MKFGTDGKRRLRGSSISLEASAPEARALDAKSFRLKLTEERIEQVRARLYAAGLAARRDSWNGAQKPWELHSENIRNPE